MGGLAYSLLMSLVFLLNNYQVSSALNRREDGNKISKNVIDKSMPKKWREVISDETQNSTAQITENWLSKNGTRCLKDTVPIVQTTIKDITKPHPLYHRLIAFSRPDGSQNHDGNDEHETVVFQFQPEHEIQEIKVKMNIWKPYVEEDNEFSTNEIWLMAGDDVIGVGWHVDPSRYREHDDRDPFGREPRFFGCWTTDGHMHYNSDGFVSEHQNLHLGDLIIPYTVVDDQGEIVGQEIVWDICIYKDYNVGGWSLEVNDLLVGHWPNTNFDTLGLEGLATHAAFFGHVRNVRSNYEGTRHTKTAMGSGYRVERDSHNACYMSDIEVTYGNDDMSVHVSTTQLTEMVTSNGCYNLKEFEDRTGFFYGGPGYDENRCR